MLNVTVDFNGTTWQNMGFSHCKCIIKSVVGLKVSSKENEINRVKKISQGSLYPWWNMCLLNSPVMGRMWHKFHF